MEVLKDGDNVVRPDLLVRAIPLATLKHGIEDLRLQRIDPEPLDPNRNGVEGFIHAATTLHGVQGRPLRLPSRRPPRSGLIEPTLIEEASSILLHVRPRRTFLPKPGSKDTLMITRQQVSPQQSVGPPMAESLGAESIRQPR